MKFQKKPTEYSIIVINVAAFLWQVIDNCLLAYNLVSTAAGVGMGAK